MGWGEVLLLASVNSVQTQIHVCLLCDELNYCYIAIQHATCILTPLGCMFGALL